MSEPSKIRWLNVVGVVAAAATLCAMPLDALRSPGIDAARAFAGWLGLMLIGMISAAIAAVVSRRRGSDNPTKTGIHVGVIAVALVTMLAVFGNRFA